MSIKIYNGRKLKKELSLNQLNSFCDNLSKKVEELQREEALLYVIGNSERFLDNKILDRLLSLEGDFERECSLFSRFTDQLREMQKNPLFKDYFNYEVSFHFYPLKNKTLMLHFCSSSLSKKIDSLVELKTDFYGYWNSSDRDEEITLKEWNTRGRDWDKALKPDYVPSRHGLSRTVCYNEYNALIKLFHNKEQLKTLIDKLATCPEKRLDNLAKRYVSKNYEKRRIKKINKEFTDLLELNSSEKYLVKKEVSDYLLTEKCLVSTDKFKSKYREKITLLSLESLMDKKYTIEKRSSK
jgi:hypothetical protein